jgi:hypothetical protein
MNRYDYMDSDLKGVISEAKDGNMKAALLEAESVFPRLRSEEERDYCDRLIRRFSTGPREKLAAGEPLAAKLAVLHENYWLASMLDDDAGHERKNELLAALKEEIPECRGAREEGEVFDRLSGLLAKDGYHALFGTTIPYSDMLLWKNQREESRHVELMDSSVDVTIRALSGFESLGWTGFSTLNLLYVGGWAVGRTINAVMPAWEGLDKEFFDIRLIIHESQHCSDYARFPGMTPIELEYRAKLAEIYYARATKGALLRMYRAEALGDGKGPHAKANFKVFEELGRRVDIDACMANNGYDLIDGAVYDMFVKSSDEMKAQMGRKGI